MKPQKPFYKRPLFYVPTGLTAIIGLIVLIFVFSAGEYILTGNTPAILRWAKLLRHIGPNRQVEAVIGLKLRNEADLDALLASQQNPASPDFHRYISPKEFIDRFSPTEQDLQKVENYLQSHRLNILEVTENRLLIRVRGKARDVEEAFQLQLNEYEYGDQTGIINDRDPRVPSEFKDLILCVIGLNDFANFHAMHKHADSHGAGDGKPAGFNPQDIATAYNHANSNNRAAHNRVSYSGKGVTVAIATAYTYTQDDVQTFWHQYGIVRTGSVTKVPVNGDTDQPNIETTLDLQQIGAQAPGADIIMYEGSSPSFITFTLVINRVVADNKASICSESWGMCEKDTGQAEMKAQHLLFKQGSAQGISFFIAAGDDGAYDCTSDKKKLVYGVDYPSSDDGVTAVGGTALRVKDDGSRLDESAWSGAGGGVSDYYNRPAWQKGNGLPDNKKRNTSDVALVSDPRTGYSLYYQGKWHKSGGTSFAAPNWAAIWALATEATGGARLGPCAPTVYRLCSSDAKAYDNVFFDITGGNNGDGRGPGYKSGKGWDHPTGWGTPNVHDLIDWLKNDKPKPVVTTPTSARATGK